MPEISRLATTIETWWSAILAFLHTGLTNAGTEGYNRLVKQVKRVACGFGQHRELTPADTIQLHPRPAGRQPAIPLLSIARPTSKSPYAA